MRINVAGCAAVLTVKHKPLACVLVIYEESIYQVDLTGTREKHLQPANGRVVAVTSFAVCLAGVRVKF